MSFSEFLRRGTSFEEQFEDIEVLEFGDEKLSSIDISPEKTSGIPILFVPGWNARLPDYRKAIELLVAAGRRVISLEPAGEEEEKARELLSFIDLKGLERIDLIAHSVGSISASLAAVQLPDRVKRLVLLNPPVSEHDPKNLIRKYRDMLSLEGAKGVADVGGRKIFEMAKVITSFDMITVRERLTGIGTKVTSIHGVSDVLFPPPPTAIPLNDDTNGAHDQFSVEGNHLHVDQFIPHALKLLES
jgi:hypothetical protein